MGTAWPAGAELNVINVTSAFSSLFRFHRSEHEKKEKKRGGKLRKDKFLSGRSNSSPESSTVSIVHSTSESQ